jgi:hypothetical protein
MHFNLIQFSFLLISFVLSVQFPVNVDIGIRKTLLSALKSFGRNDPHPHMGELVLNSFDLSQLYGIPVDLRVQIIGGFLDFESVLALRKVSVHYLELSYSMVKLRLANFCPYFVFEDVFLNDLMLYFIDKHFLESETIKSPSLPDELQVLILKYNYDGLKYDVIPRNIYFYLISFLYSLVYGINATCPVSTEAAIFDAIRLIKSSDAPLTLEYLRTHKNIVSEKNIRHLEFFAGKPTKEDVMNEYRIRDVNTFFGFNEFSIAIIESLIEYITFEGLEHFCRGGIRYFDHFYSPIISHRLALHIKDNDWDYNHRSNNFLKIELKYALCVKNPEYHPDCDVILRRIIADIPFDHDNSEYLSNPAMIELILSCFKYFDGRSNLYQIDLYSSCINSPLLPIRSRANSVRNLSYRSSRVFFETVAKENMQPFNIFCVLEPVVGMTDNIFEIAFAAYTDSFASVFFEMLHSNDPIMLLFCGENLLKSARKFIVDQFDLNKTYIFDLRPHWSYTARFFGRTIHFKQMIKELEDPELQMVFSSDPSEFEGEFVSSEPAISVHEAGMHYFRASI